MRKILYHLGRYLLFFQRMLSSREKFSVYWPEFLRECVNMGIGSVGIVIIISVFIGAVTTIQTAYQLASSFLPKTTIGYIVSTSALIEFAPTITSLVLAGKVGSNIASELGTMRVTEQIDALDVMGINSASYLVIPKLFAALVMFPCLVVVSVFLMHMGGLIAGELTGTLSSGEFWLGAQEWYDPFYIRFMLYKALLFGFTVASVSAYHGYHVKGGALQVGTASTHAVVYGCILVILGDFALAYLLL
jgi:phospholipid/cholesterol/gamma-HCH transport system permease protein